MQGDMQVQENKKTTTRAILSRRQAQTHPIKELSIRPFALMFISLVPSKFKSNGCSKLDTMLLENILKIRKYKLQPALPQLKIFVWSNRKDHVVKQLVNHVCPQVSTSWFQHNLEMTRCCTKVPAGKDLTAKLFSSALRRGDWKFNSQTEVNRFNPFQVSTCGQMKIIYLREE